MGWFDWMENAPLAVDQQVSQAPVLPQQQEQPIADQFKQWKTQKNAVVDNPLSADMITPEVVTPQSVTERPIAEEFAAWKSEQKPKSETPFKLEDTTNIAYKVGSALYEPASTALEAISYFDKPRGAIAGTVKAYQDDAPLLQGAKKGWDENTSWKETFNQDWVRANPKKAAVAGLAADIAVDPLWFLTPAKLAKGVSKASKATGLTDNVINPAVKAISESEAGKKTIAFAEDNIIGKNRIADRQFEYNARRAKDQVEGQDYVDELKGIKKQFPNEAEKITDYIQAKPRDLNAGTIAKTDAEIIASAKAGTLSKEILDGVVSRDKAFTTMKNSGEEMPDFLLQDAQKFAKSEGKAIPDTVYRDEILATIPQTGARKVIQMFGDKFAELNKRYGDQLHGTDWLSTDQRVRSLDGEHLRRSTAKWENPEKFLADLKKAGKQDEWEKAYIDYQGKKGAGSQGFGANHKVDTKDFIGRQNLSDDTLKKMGIITDPEYRIMDTINRGSKTLQEDKFLKDVSKDWGVDEKTASKLSFNLPDRRKYVKVPETEGFGALKGQYIPKDVHDKVLKTMGIAPDSISLTWQKGVGAWKVAKLANPASVMRNFYSGIPMANVNGKVPFQALPKYVSKVTLAFKEGGKNHPLIRSVRESGILPGWNKNDLPNIFGDNPKGLAKAADWSMEAFGSPDKFWKTVVVAYHVDHGKTPMEAAKIANKALLDYGNAPDWINWLSKTGAMPFAKFPYAAGKETVKGLYNAPAQITKYTKAQNQANTNDRKAIMPDYMKARTLLPLWDSERIVNGKPQKVQNNLDLSYILPFASDVKFGNPITDALQLASTGRNGLGMEVIDENMTPKDKVKAYSKYALNSFGPSLPIPGNYAWEKLENGIKGNVDAKGRQYDWQSAASQVLLGAKNVPINTGEMAQQKIKSIEYAMKDTKSKMTKIAKSKDTIMSKEQKAEQMQDYAKQYSELARKLKETTAAAKREKQRGSQ